MTLEVETAEQEAVLVQFHTYLLELSELALAAPDGEVVDRCEEAAVAGEREIHRRVLEQAVQRRIDAAEKKGRRCGSVHVDRPARIVAPRGGKS